MTTRAAGATLVSLVLAACGSESDSNEAGNPGIVTLEKEAPGSRRDCSGSASVCPEGEQCFHADEHEVCLVVTCSPPNPKRCHADGECAETERCDREACVPSSQCCAGSYCLSTTDCSGECRPR